MWARSPTKGTRLPRGPSQGPQVEYDSDPTEAGKILLVFDPRGQSIEILGGGAVYMSLAFPAA